MPTTTDRQTDVTGFSGAVLYIALELSAKKWKVAFHDGRRARPRVATIDAWDFDALAHQIERARRAMDLPVGARVRSCYEAGREGFSVHRRLVQMGIDNVVIDAASVDVSRRARRAKTDRLDAEMLVTKLFAHHRGERAFAVVRVPTPVDEGTRHEQRHLDDLKVERGRHKVRIQSLLLTEGIATRWSSALIKSLDTLQSIDGRRLAPRLLERLRDESELLHLVQKQIDTIEAARKKALQDRKDAEKARQKVEPKDQMLPPEKDGAITNVDRVSILSSLKGIGTTSAFKLIIECFGWRQFKTRREVAGCLGLAPSPFASGKVDHEQGISKLGNPDVRALLIELSWLWLRYQPTSKITLWFQEKFAKGAGRARRIGIVAVARKLAIAIWKFTAFGVVPEGAIMKT